MNLSAAYPVPPRPRTVMRILAFALFLTLALNLEAVDLSRPIAEVRLQDGRVLHQVRIVSYGSTSVMARWDGGGHDRLPAPA